MKKEASKKTKKWLWLLIGVLVLAAAAGTVFFLLAGNGNEDIEQTEAKGGRPELYWNVDKALYTQDSASGFSTREAGEDGVYRVRFAYNGDIVELPVADKKLVNLIDTMDIMGLVKDEEGTVVDIILLDDIATPIAVNAYVQQVKGDKIVANSSIAMNGMQYKIELGDMTEIYDVSSTAKVPGGIIDTSVFQAMDTIWVYGTEDEEVTHIYLTDHPVESAVYWRAVQMWNSTEKSTSRVPDENGVYSIDFCSDGGIVTLKCKDKSIVTSIDNKSPHSCHFGFIFDEEGYIIDIMNSGIGIRGAVAAERIEVEELDGSYFSGTQLIPSDNGLSYSANLPEDCIIYDASSAAMREGRQGQQVDSLKLGDRICVWTDPNGTPVLVYIANRLADATAYYNLARKYDGTLKQTKRVPNSAGYYEFEMVETGKLGKVVVKTNDKDVATFIDSIANSVVGLKVENGIIQYAYTDDDIFGWTSVYGGYVPQIQGSIVSMVSFSKPDTPTNVVMNMEYKAYDVSGKDVTHGTETTLRVGDIATVTRNVSYNGVVVYITRRLVGGNTIYYNLDYQYNSTTKETKRVPDEDGYYVFKMAHRGEQVVIKTKSKELANKIDKSPNGDLVVSLNVVNGIAYEVYDTQAAYGQSLNSGWRIASINGDGTYTVNASNGSEKVLKMASDCIIYNVSTVFDDHRGERTYSLKVGDMVVSLADYRGEVKCILVRNRYVDKMYVNKNRQYDASTKLTLREPDAEGWYWFELAVEGEVKSFKTQNVELASSIDSYSTPFGLRVKDDLILNVTGPTYVSGVYKVGVNGWDVTSVSGNSAKIKYNKPGYSNTGEVKTLSISSNVKVFDISPTATSFGAATKLQVGDRVLTYASRTDSTVYVYILFHASRENGTVAYCEHCEKEVLWHPWAGASWDGVDCHYYLSADITISNQTSVGNLTKDYEVVLDLNGKKLSVNGARAFLAYRGDDISIIDSVGGGEVAATGVNGGNGGTVLVSGESTFNLYSGTLSFIDSELDIRKGAVMYVATDSTFNMYGGTIKGGIVNTVDAHAQGGNIYLYGATFNLYDGLLTEGHAERIVVDGTDVAAQGGNIYAVRESIINMHGGVISNGYSNQHGGNLFLSTATLNLYGGQIMGGECVYSGGNLYNQFAAVLNISGGEICNGKAGALGNNLYAPQDSNELHATGGLITGDIVLGNTKTVSVSGTPKITMGDSTGLSLPSTAKLVIGELTDGAEIYISAKGVFSEPNMNAQAYLDNGYIKSADARNNIQVVDNALSMVGELSYCEHCGDYVEWVVWPGTTKPASGHYFISKDYKQSSQLTIAADTDVVLDLYGHTYSSENIRNFLVRGTLSIMDSVGGGVMVSTCGSEFAGAIALVGTEAGSVRPAGFNLYSGTLKLADNHPQFKNAGLIAFSGGELNIYGGTMIGGDVTNSGGCIAVQNANSVMNMFGGTITGGTAPTGGCVYMMGTLNMVGGTIEGEVYIDTTSQGVLLAGIPVIDNLRFASGKLADVSGLSEGAEIGITASGVFTEELDGAEDYIGYFYPVNSEMALKSNGSALEITIGQGFFDRVNGVHVQAEKMTDDGIFAAGGTIVAVCPVCGVEVEWTELNTVTDVNIRADGHYYLSADVTMARQYNFYATNACLHLNGHNITSGERGIYVDATSTTMCTLNIMGKGVVSGSGYDHDKIPRGTVDVGGCVNFYGGTFVATGKNPTVTARGYYGRSVINIYDGAEFKGNSVNLLVNSQVVNVYGGNFVSGTTKIETTSNTYNSLNIYGGTYSGNGQIIAATGSKGNLYIAGGTFENGSIYVAADFGDVTVVGNPVIAKLDLSSGKLATIKDLSAGASIGVIANDAFTVENAKAADYLAAGYIKAAQTGNVITEYNGVLYMERQTTYCEHCGQNVTWDVWPGHNSPASGHYFIEDDYTGQTSQWSIAAGSDVVLDLRGYTYSTTGIRNFLVRGVFSIMDTVGGGEMVTTGDTSAHGGIAYVQNASNDISGACLNIYGGTLRMADDHASVQKGGVIQATTGAIVNMYGGTIKGGATTISGGNVNIGSANTIFNMYGGEIIDGEAPAGGAVYVLGIFNMTGGSIAGDVYLDTTADTNISNAVVINKMTIVEGVVIGANGLTTGAEIGIDAKGVFTKPMNNADSYLGYFKKLHVDDKLYVEGNSIGVKRESPQDRLNNVHTEAEKMTDDGVFAGGGTVTAVCPVCGTEEQWKPLTGFTGANKKIDADGHYYLAEDLQLQGHFSFYANACLHLNGKNITSTARAIYVEANYNSTTKVYTVYSLNIMGDGVVTGSGVMNTSTNQEYAPPRGAMDIGGSLNLFGGTYVSSNHRPAITARGFYGKSVMNIYEGTEVVGAGEAMRVRSQEVNVYGGSFRGGRVYVDGSANSKLNVYGGVFENTGDMQGANVYVAGSKASANIAGGKFLGGEVYVTADAASVEISGDAAIENLNLTSGKKITLGEMDGAEIYVTADGAITDALTDAEAYLENIKAADNDLEVVVQANALVVRLSEAGTKNRIHTVAEKMTTDGVFASGGTVVATCPVCGTEEQWTEIHTVAYMKQIKTSGHYYLAEDVNITGSNHIGFYANACLHLNGHNITSASERAIYVEATSTMIATLNIMGNGTVTGAGLAHATVPRGALDIGGTLNLYGGTYVATGNNPALTARGFVGRSFVNIYNGVELTAPNVSLLVRSNAVNMYGGAIVAGSVKVDGGSTCSFNLYGGTIANSNDNQVAVTAAGASGTVNLAGGEISGEVYIAENISAISVSGDIVITDLNLTSGKKLTLGNLGLGADITVNANDGAFVDPSSRISRYADYFKASSADKTIAVEGTTLVVKAA